MSEFDDVDETDGEADETGAADIEVGVWCVAGLVAFDAAAGLDFPDELSNGESGLDPGASTPAGKRWCRQIRCSAFPMRRQAKRRSR